MPNTFEPLPSTQLNCPFPGGDILGTAVENAEILLSEIKIGNREQQVSQLLTMSNAEVNDWRCMPEQKKIYVGLKNLLDAWANTTRDPISNTAIARIGSFSTLAFIKSSELLPVKFDNFSDELSSMSTYNSQTIKFLGDETWSLMYQTHPKAYDVLAPFVGHLRELYDISPEDESRIDLLYASAALPYLMASTTRMTRFLIGELNDPKIIEKYS